MAAFTPQGRYLLYGWQKNNRFSRGLGKELPAAYVKFWREWKNQDPAPVHYEAKEKSHFEYGKHGEVQQNQQTRIPLMRVPEEHEGIWGGESVIKGFYKKDPLKRRIPHFWFPVLKQSVVKSDVLNENFHVNVTDRTIQLIHEHKGFDHYLLKTPACDLRSLLALKIKKRVYLDIMDGFPAWQGSLERQQELTEEFKQYRDMFTPEEIEWYALDFQEARKKIANIKREKNVKLPHKEIFRKQLVEQLRAKAATIAIEN